MITKGGLASLFVIMEMFVTQLKARKGVDRHLFLYCVEFLRSLANEQIQQEIESYFAEK